MKSNQIYIISKYLKSFSNKMMIMKISKGKDLPLISWHSKLPSVSIQTWLARQPPKNAFKPVTLRKPIGRLGVTFLIGRLRVKAWTRDQPIIIIYKSLKFYRYFSDIHWYWDTVGVVGSIRFGYSRLQNYRKERSQDYNGIQHFDPRKT